MLPSVYMITSENVSFLVRLKSLFAFITYLFLNSFNPDDKKTFFGTADNAKGYNLIHLNALYDLLNRRFIGAVL